MVPKWTSYDQSTPYLLHLIASSSLHPQWQKDQASWTLTKTTAPEINKNYQFSNNNITHRRLRKMSEIDILECFWCHLPFIVTKNEFLSKAFMLIEHVFLTKIEIPMTEKNRNIETLRLCYQIRNSMHDSLSWKLKYISHNAWISISFLFSLTKFCFSNKIKFTKTAVLKW